MPDIRIARSELLSDLIHGHIVDSEPDAYAESFRDIRTRWIRRLRVHTT